MIRVISMASMLLVGVFLHAAFEEVYWRTPPISLVPMLLMLLIAFGSVYIFEEKP